jgi:hypothetical protein
VSAAAIGPPFLCQTPASTRKRAIPRESEPVVSVQLSPYLKQILVLHLALISWRISSATLRRIVQPLKENEAQQLHHSSRHCYRCIQMLVEVTSPRQSLSPWLTDCRSNCA